MRDSEESFVPKHLDKADKAYIDLMDQLVQEGGRIASTIGADPRRDGLLATYYLAQWVLKQKDQEHNKPGLFESTFQRNKAKINKKLKKDLEERTEVFKQTGYTNEEKEAHLPRTIELAIHDYTAQCKYYKGTSPAITPPKGNFTKMWQQRWSAKLQQSS